MVIEFVNFRNIKFCICMSNVLCYFYAFWKLKYIYEEIFFCAFFKNRFLTPSIDDVIVYIVFP